MGRRGTIQFIFIRNGGAIRLGRDVQPQEGSPFWVIPLPADRQFASSHWRRQPRIRRISSIKAILPLDKNSGSYRAENSTSCSCPEGCRACGYPEPRRKLVSDLLVLETCIARGQECLAATARRCPKPEWPPGCCRAHRNQVHP